MSDWVAGQTHGSIVTTFTEFTHIEVEFLPKACKLMKADDFISNISEMNYFYSVSQTDIMVVLKTNAISMINFYCSIAFRGTEYSPMS